MGKTDPSSPSEVKALLREYNLRAKKRFGQNFLVDKNILGKIVDAANLKGNEYVIEIGPGLGALTNALTKEVRKVVALEIDRDLVAILKGVVDLEKVAIICGDALALNWREVIAKEGWQGEKVKLVANLPYYLTTPLIMKALEEAPFVYRVVVMVQKEVASRMVAHPGSKDYGILSLVVQYYSQPSIVCQVPRRVFLPVPDVDSAVVCLDRIEPPVLAPKEELFAVIRASFNQRRKTLRNTLRHYLKDKGRPEDFAEQAIAMSDLDANCRGEELGLEEFSRLTINLMERINPPVE